MRLYTGRLRFLVLLFTFPVFGVLCKAWNLQITHGSDYQKRASERRVYSETALPLRGVITDRNDRMLAKNQPSFTLAVIPNEIRDHFSETRKQKKSGEWLQSDTAEKWTLSLAKELAYTPERIRKSLAHMKKQVYDKQWHKQRQPFSLFTHIPTETAHRLDVLAEKFPGIVINTPPRRSYPYRELGAHMIGYLGKADHTDIRALINTNDFLKVEIEEALADKAQEREYPQLHDAYQSWMVDDYKNWLAQCTQKPPIDFEGWFFYKMNKLGYPIDRQVGKSGLENKWEPALRGTPGKQVVDWHIRFHRKEILSKRAPQPGSRFAVSLDIELQRTAMEALEKQVRQYTHSHAGAFVMMDVHTGETLVLASYPSFDPNELIPPVSHEAFANIFQNPAKPLLNRATRGLYPLGSIFKMVTATAFLEKKPSHKDKRFNCQGYLLTGEKFKCWIYNQTGHGHGILTIKEAIKRSCNVYFHKAAIAASSEDMSRWAKAFGFGKKSGLEIFESSGNLPSTRTQGALLNLSIGQGAFLCTPLQVAAYVGALANNGKLMRPTLIKNSGPVTPQQILKISPKTLDIIRQGMEKVVHESHGTAQPYFNLPNIRVAGKTGTAQAGKGKADHAWFAGFAPADDPKVSFVALIEHGEHGGPAAAPVAEAVLRNYFNDLQERVKP